MSRSRLFGAAVVAAALASTIVAPPATAVATAGSLRASATSVTAGALITFSGELPTKVRRPIVLQRKTASGWSRVKAGKTSRKGKIAIAALASSVAGKYSYRVAAPREVIGRKTFKALKTPAAPLTVVVLSPAPPPAPTLSAPTPPVPPAPGSRENPLAVNTPFQSAWWRFNIGSADFDAWPEIAAENMFNDPPAPGWSYVTVPVTYTYLGADTGHPFWDTDLEFVGNDGLVYDEGVADQYCGVVPNQTSDMADMFAGATATGNECVPVPAHAIAGGHWRVSGETFPTNWVYVKAS